MSENSGRTLSLAFALLLAAASQTYADVPSDLYINAAAVAAHCRGQELTDGVAAALAAEIARSTGEQLPIDSIRRRVAKAQAAFASAGDCGSPVAQIHMHFFRNIVSPRAPLRANDPNTAG